MGKAVIMFVIIRSPWKTMKSDCTLVIFSPLNIVTETLDWQWTRKVWEIVKYYKIPDLFDCNEYVRSH